MNGYSFDVTCKINGSESYSIEFILPTEKRAENNDYTTISRPWQANAMELKILKADKLRDEGLYKCLVNGSDEIETNIEFVTEAFVSLSTPNPILRRIKDESSIFEMIINFVALPFPIFSVSSGKNFVPTDVKKAQVSSNQLRLLDHESLNLFTKNVTVSAVSENRISKISFLLILEGDQFSN